MLSGRSTVASGYRSQYFCGATKGKCGRQNPHARKNGASPSARRRMSANDLSHSMWSGYSLSGTSADSKAGPRSLSPAAGRFSGLAHHRLLRSAPRRFTPGPSVIIIVMVNLPVANRRITVLLKHERQRRHAACVFVGSRQIGRKATGRRS